jgi:prepilin-type N-terminal cleavage/methylation domain-containing protein
MQAGDGMRKGFTLLEMVISISILAAMAAFLVVAFRLTGQSLARGEEEAIAMARLRAGIEILERAIRSGDPASIFPSEGTFIPYFRGERAKIRFLSASPPSSVSGGYRMLCFYGAESRGDAAGLMLSDSSPLRGAGVENWEGTEKARVLLPGASEVVFHYSPGPTDEGKWEWVEEWDANDKKSLPAAVRVEFVTPSEGGSLKTALVIPVPAGGS